MGLWKSFAKFADRLVGTAALVVRDNFADVAMALTMPQVNTALRSMVPVQPRSPWLSSRLAAKTVDGAIMEGSGGWQKLAIKKGLPTGKEKRLGVENDPHEVDGFSGTIAEGYGKGQKMLLADEIVVTKVGGQSRLGRLNYHRHEADRAGLHYDLVVEGVRPGTPKWELHIPRGPHAGRYAFVRTPRGFVINPMVDRGKLFTKPQCTLKDESFLTQVEANRHLYHISRKVDGSSAKATIVDYRAHFHSHRPEGRTYYDRLPALEDLSNRSPFWLYRKLFRGADQNGTELIGDICHVDGAARQGGILNSMPDKAIEIQIRRGSSTFHTWDIERYRGRDISHMPFERREAYMLRAIADIRRFNRNYHTVEVIPDGVTVPDYFQYVLSDPLPWGEGLVVKRRDSVERAWFKVKRKDTVDLVVVDFVEGDGKYADSLGALVIEGENGARGRIGSFKISDEHRDWIWENQDLLRGQVAEIEAFEMTERGVPRAGRFVRWHPSKSEGALLMYAETLSGGEGREAMMSTKYALIQSARRV